MSDVKLVIENAQENIGGKNCRLKTNRYANGNIVIEVSDFNIDTTNNETIAQGLEQFKHFQETIKTLEESLNKPKEQ